MQRADPDLAPPGPVDPKVLVVDDEPHLLESTALLIESLGYATVRLEDASAVMETAEHESVGLILQDVSMRGLNLSGLVAMLRAHPATTEVPLVFYGGQDDLSTMAARYDAWGYLTKPFGRGEMEALLDRVFHPADGDPALAPRQVKRQLRDLFHDQWDLLCALNNYIQVLDGSVPKDESNTRCIEGLDATLLKLEAKTDRLRSYVLSLADGLEPVEEVDRG